MGRSSNRMWAIAVFSKESYRELTINSIMGEDESIGYKSLLEIKSGFIGTNGGYFSNKMKNIKTWKTYSGCQSYLNKIALGQYYIEGDLNGIKVKITTPVYRIVEITELWNIHIDSLIKSELDRHNTIISKLMKLKLAN